MYKISGIYPGSGHSSTFFGIQKHPFIFLYIFLLLCLLEFCFVCTINFEKNQDNITNCDGGQGSYGDFLAVGYNEFLLEPGSIEFNGTSCTFPSTGTNSFFPPLYIYIKKVIHIF